MSRTLSRCCLLLAVLALPLSATAEGVYKEGEATTPPVAKPKPRHVIAKKAPPVTPAAPIPYTAYSAGPIKSATVTTAPTPVVTTNPPIVIAPSPILPLQGLPLQPIEAPPPAPPAAPPIVTAPAAPTAPTEISLKCETRTTHGKKVVSSGTFYIDLFPSPVFPDQNADFKFLFADPAHDSLIRDTMCLDTTCTAEVSGTAYYLVNRVTKKGAALRITLDRVKGAFYAEEMGKHGSDHLGEQGYCTVQPLPNSMF